MKTPITLEGKTVFVTGSAGFIGANLVKRLFVVPRIRIIGIDNMNDYYDVSLKEYRLQELEKAAALAEGSEYHFIRGNLADKDCIVDIFSTWHPDIVVNLAAQAGVRYSITNPDVYIESNLIGFYNILEACRHSYDGGAKGVEHLVYASSSSVYGGNTKVPFSTDDKVDHPVSLYAATKKSDELLAHCYAKLYNIPSTGLRFFTVYGPAGRPENLLRFVDILQQELLRAGVLPEGYDFESHKKLVPMQPGDVPVTYADTEALEKDYGYRPSTTLREGLRKFAEWYKTYYHI